MKNQIAGSYPLNTIYRYNDERVPVILLNKYDSVMYYVLDLLWCCIELPL
jgi:hypothetical protein